jgi:hypothetical protein
MVLRVTPPLSAYLGSTADPFAMGHISTVVFIEVIDETPGAIREAHLG